MNNLLQRQFPCPESGKERFNVTSSQDLDHVSQSAEKVKVLRHKLCHFESQFISKNKIKTKSFKPTEPSKNASLRSLKDPLFVAEALTVYPVLRTHFQPPKVSGDASVSVRKGRRPRGDRRSLGSWCCWSWWSLVS